MPVAVSKGSLAGSVNARMELLDSVKLGSSNRIGFPASGSTSFPSTSFEDLSPGRAVTVPINCCQSSLAGFAQCGFLA